MERVRDRDSTSSSDDEEGGDLETLITQNETKASPAHRGDNHHRHYASASTFEIGDLKNRIRRGFWSSRKYLLAICIPLLLLLFYFTFDLRRLFPAVSYVPVDSPADRMREAELHALYLLRNQQLGLLRLWNRTSVATPRSGSTAFPSPAVVTSSNSTSNSTVFSNYTAGGQAGVVGGVIPSSPPPTVSLEEFRSALLEQIKLNGEIRKALLSTHHFVNVTSGAPDDNVDLYFSDFSGEGGDVCGKVAKPAERRTIYWKPKKDRYLLAICVSGQMSNHLICLEKHMFFAALLNRVLILPSAKFDYQYDKVIDIQHINDCFGRKVVVSFEEFAEAKKNKMRIDRFICYMAKPPCFVDEEHAKRLKALGLSLAKLEAAWPEDAKSEEQKKRVSGDITSKFSSEDEVLAIGDVFYADVEEEWVMQPGGPLSHKCKTVIQPSHLITLTAERFVQTFLGNNFIAFHFRRHGFLKFCNAKEESCFFPIPQAAECILRVVKRANAPVIYLSTDAAGSETDLLQSLIVLNDKKVPLVKRPDHNPTEKWDALLYRNHLGGDNQVEAMLDKTICAMSSVFVGASGSTFTEDIYRLRTDWGSASVCDEYLCQGRQPNFIASKE